MLIIVAIEILTYFKNSNYIMYNFQFTRSLASSTWMQNEDLGPVRTTISIHANQIPSSGLFFRVDFFHQYG